MLSVSLPSSSWVNKFTVWCSRSFLFFQSGSKKSIHIKRCIQTITCGGFLLGCMVCIHCLVRNLCAIMPIPICPWYLIAVVISGLYLWSMCWPTPVWFASVCVIAFSTSFGIFNLMPLSFICASIICLCSVIFGCGHCKKWSIVSSVPKYNRPWHTIVCHDQLEGLPPKISSLNLPLGTTNPPGYY
jgi:hypothetical protein